MLVCVFGIVGRVVGEVGCVVGVEWVDYLLVPVKGIFFFF